MIIKDYGKGSVRNYCQEMKLLLSIFDPLLVLIKGKVRCFTNKRMSQSPIFDLNYSSNDNRISSLFYCNYIERNRLLKPNKYAPAGKKCSSYLT
jgi:hypothetical protein